MSHDTTPIRPVSRRRFLGQAGAAMATTALTPGVLGQLSSASAARPTRRPNIVLVVADDLGWNEVGAYGQQLIQTPTLDRLAAEGVRYTDFYSGGPVCAPARCTLLTGMHTGRCTVRNNPQPGQGDEPFAEDEVTIGHVLQSVGYRTALFGKWGFSPDQPGHHSHPNAQGFDEFFGYLTHQHAHSYYPTHLWHNDERVELPENAGGAQQTYAPDLFTDRCLDFVQQHHDEPFMIFWSTNIPHFPQQVPDLGPYADTDWRAGEKAHAAQITRMDADIDRLISTLTDLGIADDTIVLFCGDNGPHEEGSPSLNPDFFQASSPYRGYKRNLLEGGIRVPAIVWAPGLQPHGGIVSDHPWAMWDVLPTLADLADAPAPPYVDGLPMRGAITGAAAPPEHEFQYWWRLEPFSTSRAAAAENGRVRQAAEAVRRGQWKALRYAPGRVREADDDQWQFELYNLRTDPAERTDVAADHPDIAAALLTLMHRGWAEPPYDRVSWSPGGIAAYAPRQLAPGRQGIVTVALTNHHDRLPATEIDLDLILPDGWPATAPDRSPALVLRPGESTAVSFVVTPPESQQSGAVSLMATARFRRGSTRETSQVIRPVTMLPAPPVATSYVSDLDWLSATNGWGPVERDMSNGRDHAGDGPPIALAGRVYEKGLGVHAPSEVIYYLGGAGDRFTSDIGIDDFSANQSGNGSVVFQVWADDVKIYDSGVLTAATGPRSVDVSVAGADWLRLVVTNAGDGNTHDHSSWADATVHVVP